MRQSNNMNEDETAEFKEAFALFDKDGDGVITPLELGVALRAMGQEPSDEDLKVRVRASYEAATRHANAAHD